MAFNSRHNETRQQPNRGSAGAFSVPVIEWEPKSRAEEALIVHKHETENFPSGSVLVVRHSQIAVLFCSQPAANRAFNTGTRAQTMVFLGPCQVTLDTGDPRFAPLRESLHTMTDGKPAFHSSVYFISAARWDALSWGTQEPIPLIDPEEEVLVHVRAWGNCSVRIDTVDTSVADERVLTFLSRTVGQKTDFSQEDLAALIRAQIQACVPDPLAGKILGSKIGVMNLGGHYSELSKEIFQELRPRLERMGITLDRFSIENINIPEEDQALIGGGKTRLHNARIDAEVMGIQSKANADRRALEGFTFQEEKYYETEIKYAESFGTAGSAAGAAHFGTVMGMAGAIGADVRRISEAHFERRQYGNASAEGMPLCPNPACRTQLPRGAKFCHLCRTRVMRQACPHCGAELRDNARFCSNCSEPV